MRKDLESLVRRRAGGRCEYCLLPQGVFRFNFPIDHIIARQHRDRTRADNLALACTNCNRHKGPNIAGIDPLSQALMPLYHPRRDRWADHFAWQGPRIIGTTPIGRATVQVFAMNQRE